MKSNVLRAPLVKSAVILLVFSLLFYLTATSPEGSIWCSLGAIFIGALRTVQWLIGLSIGLVISIAVLIAIFLGAAAMFNPASASRMYEGLRSTLMVWLAPVINLFKSDREEQLAAALEGLGQELKKEISVDIQAGQNDLRKGQAKLTTAVNSLSGRLTTLEETTATLAASEQVETLDEEIKGTAATVAELKGGVATLENKIAQTADTNIGDLPARIEALEQQEVEPAVVVDLAPLEEDIAALRSEFKAMQEQDDSQPDAAPPTGAEQPEPTAAEEGEHRIFSYFDDPADKEKVAETVASTLKKDMSYKQVMDLVAKGLGGGAKGKIFTSHPSLSKDYIRQCRREN